MPDDTQTPMLDRLRAVNAQSQAIGEFLEWLRARDITLDLTAVERERRALLANLPR